MKHNLLLNDDLTHKISLLVYDYKLHLYGIDYYSFGFNDYSTGLAYSFSSRPEWFDFLKKDEDAGNLLLNYDYIWKNSFKFHDDCILEKINFNERTLLLSSFDYSSSIHKEIIKYKRKFSINRGVGYLEHSFMRTFSSNFFTNYSKFNELDFSIYRKYLMKDIHEKSKKIVMKHFRVSFLPKLLEQQIQVPHLLYSDHKYQQ